MDETPPEIEPAKDAEESPAEPASDDVSSAIDEEIEALDDTTAADDPDAEPEPEPDSEPERIDEESILLDDEPDDLLGLPELFGLPPSDDDEPDIDDLIRACRNGIHDSNNALTGLIQECELATMSEDPARLKLAIERISTHADALTRINREMRASLGRFPGGR